MIAAVFLSQYVSRSAMVAATISATFAEIVVLFGWCDVEAAVEQFN